VTNLTMRLARGAALLAAVGLVATCGLPRSGPNKSEIFAGSVQREGDAFILSVDDRVNRIAGVTPAMAFSAAFANAGLLGSDTVQAGDVLSISVWENVDDGLLVANGQNATTLNEVQVDGSGFITVPYAGRIRAAKEKALALATELGSRSPSASPSSATRARARSTRSSTRHSRHCSR